MQVYRQAIRHPISRKFCPNFWKQSNYIGTCKIISVCMTHLNISTLSFNWEWVLSFQQVHNFTQLFEHVILITGEGKVSQVLNCNWKDYNTSFHRSGYISMFKFTSSWDTRLSFSLSVKYFLCPSCSFFCDLFTTSSAMTVALLLATSAVQSSESLDISTSYI